VEHTLNVEQSQSHGKAVLILFLKNRGMKGHRAWCTTQKYYSFLKPFHLLWNKRFFWNLEVFVHFVSLSILFFELPLLAAHRTKLLSLLLIRNRDKVKFEKLFQKTNNVQLTNCETKCQYGLHEQSPLFFNFINITAYRLGQYKPSSPSTKELHVQTEQCL